MNNKEYVELNGKECPFCNNKELEKELSGIQKIENPTNIYVDCYCKKCEKVWTESFKLDGYGTN